MNQITDIPGIRVGHAQDEVGLTGCTVVLCEAGAVGGVAIRGGAPGTRETELLYPGRLAPGVHAVLLTGGSAFGLDAATGVVRYLAERGIGFDAGVARVPLVPAAVLFDLTIGDPAAHPDADMGYRACQAATAGPVAEGNAGAGYGATVGKILGPQQAMKAGIGSAAVHLGQADNELIVGAIVAVNSLGSIVDPETGRALAGPRDPVSGTILDTLTLMGTISSAAVGDAHAKPVQPFSHTTIGVVATNATLTKEQVNVVAGMAHDGMARAVRPAHTLYDGDTLFALATGDLSIPVDVSIIGAWAAEVVALAIVRAVRLAASASGLPAWKDVFPADVEH
jgi:L-aminopeptidase/D-esterase-like protein